MKQSNCIYYTHHSYFISRERKLYYSLVQRRFKPYKPDSKTLRIIIVDNWMAVVFVTKIDFDIQMFKN